MVSLIRAKGWLLKNVFVFASVNGCTRNLAPSRTHYDVLDSNRAQASKTFHSHTATIFRQKLYNFIQSPSGCLLLFSVQLMLCSSCQNFLMGCKIHFLLAMFCESKSMTRVLFTRSCYFLLVSQTSTPHCLLGHGKVQLYRRLQRDEWLMRFFTPGWKQTLRKGEQRLKIRFGAFVQLDCHTIVWESHRSPVIHGKWCYNRFSE